MLDNELFLNYSDWCFPGTSLDFGVAYPGDFSSDAKFFVLIGILSLPPLLLSFLSVSRF
jgi:hypothetical protein